MPINPSDIKMLESERLTDESDGGGRATGREITNGQVNNLFDDISRIDRTGGKVSLRKVFSGPIINDDDRYLGSHTILTRNAGDPLVDVLLFNTGSDSDVRDDARARIESYVNKTNAAQWSLVGTHYADSTILFGKQDLAARTPAVGDVFVLEQPVENSDPLVQYVRIRSIDSSEYEFTSTNNDGSYSTFTAKRLDITITSPLAHDFHGGNPTQGGTVKIGDNDVPVIFETQANSNRRYFGVKQTVEAVSVNDTSIKVDSIYSQVVPTATSDKAITDREAFGDDVDVQPAKNSTISTSQKFGGVTGSETTSYLNSPVVPNTLILNIDGGVYRDRGTGTLSHVSGSNNFSEITVDHDSGRIVANRTSGSYTGTASATWKPGAGLVHKPVSMYIGVEIATQSNTYALDMSQSKPIPGTLEVQYAVLGDWYSVRDDGDGNLTGDGTGTINYATGSAVVSFLALPDLDSEILYSYSVDTGVTATVRGDTPVYQTPKYVIDTDNTPNRDSVVVRYMIGGSQETATETGGIITGTGITGYVEYHTNRIVLEPTGVLFDDGSTIEVDYDFGGNSTNVTGSVNNGDFGLNFTLADTPVIPETFEASITVNAYRSGSGSSYQDVVKFSDDGLGNLIGHARVAGGTIDYSTGQVSIPNLTSDVNYNYTVQELVE